MDRQLASGITRAQIDAATARVPVHELPSLLLCANALAQSPPATPDSGPYLTLLRRTDVSNALKVAAGLLNLHWRHLRRQDPGSHDPSPASELLLLTAQVGAFQADPPRSRVEAGQAARSHIAGCLMPELSDGRFVQLAHEAMLGRGCQPHELLRWQAQLANGEATRPGLLSVLLQEAVDVTERDAARNAGTEQLFHVMGTGERVTLADWQARAAALPALAAEAAAHPQRFHIKSPPRVLISAINSLYAGGEHIERFMENIVGQTCFDDHAELIIVDANSPDGERAVIERHLRRRPNIKYIPINHRIGIYDAWNIAVKAAAGDYLTSANVDDLRRPDSLELQAATLDNLPFVDVVYQDFYYSMDPTLTFDQVAAFGYKSDLPLVTPHGLMALNPPHNAPMWRRRLHDELGLFDPSFVSAGDYDFWMRCVLAGKTFFKLNDAHIAYYQNPKGISTRPGTLGHEETRRVHKRYGRRLVSPNLVMPPEEFRSLCRPHPAQDDDIAGHSRLTIVHRALLAAAKAAKQAARS